MQVGCMFLCRFNSDCIILILYVVFLLCVDFDVSVRAEDGSIFKKLPPKNVLMRIWKVNSSAESNKPSPQAVSYVPDTKVDDDKPGHFHFRLGSLIFE